MAINHIITADIGGTNTRIAIVKMGTYEVHQLLRIKTSEIEDITRNLNMILEEAHEREKIEIAHCALAVAGKIEGNQVKLTNAPLTISKEHILNNSLLGRVELLNDAQAAAYGTLIFDKSKQKRAVITLGTGLGTAIINPDFSIVSTEFSHTPLEHEIAPALKRSLKREPVWEDILSARGLEHLYKKHTKKKASAYDIKDPQTFRVFRDVLAAYCNWLTTQGVEAIYITGGIPLNHNIITKSFRAKLDSIPITLIEDELLALKGAAYALN